MLKTHEVQLKGAPSSGTFMVTVQTVSDLVRKIRRFPGKVDIEPQSVSAANHPDHPDEGLYGLGPDAEWPGVLKGLRRLSVYVQGYRSGGWLVHVDLVRLVESPVSGIW